MWPSIVEDTAERHVGVVDVVRLLQIFAAAQQSDATSKSNRLREETFTGMATVPPSASKG